MYLYNIKDLSDIAWVYMISMVLRDTNDYSLYHLRGVEEWSVVDEIINLPGIDKHFVLTPIHCSVFL